MIPFYSTFGLGQIGVSVHDTTMVVGDEIFVPIYVDSSLTGEGVSSYNLQLSFNDYYFEVDSAFITGTLSDGWGTFAYNTNITERITLAAAGSTDLAGTGILAYVRVRAIRSGTVNLSFTDTTNNYFNEGSPRILLDYGRISISAKPTIRVYPDSELLTKGDTKQFSASYGTAPYSWSVTDPSVASIDLDGVLTANSKGATRVVAMDSNGIIDTSDGDVEIRSFRLSTRDTSYYQGQTVDIPIYTSDLSGLNYTAGEFTLELNEDLLTPVEIITSGTLLSGYGTPSYSFTNGELKVSFAGTTPLTGSGILLIVKFQITPENTGGTYLSFTNVLCDEYELGNSIRSYFRVLELANLNISPNTGTLLVGETLQFSASNGTEPYTWSVSNTALASIDNTGLLTAVKGGIITVSAEDSFGGSGTSGIVNLFDTQITIPDTTADIGAVIDLPIRMADLPAGNSVFSLQTDILFDSSRVKFDQIITTETLTSGWSFSANNLGNKVIISGAHTTGFSTAGTIVKLRFNVSPNVLIGNYSNVSLENFLFNEGEPNALIDNGRITISTSSIPSPPSNLVALTTGATQISLMWADNSNDESGFKIERKIGATGTWSQLTTVSQNTTTYINSGLVAGTVYYYRVRAYNSVGDSDYSNETSASTGGTPPNAPTNLLATTIDSNAIRLVWEDNSTDEDGFTVEQSFSYSGTFTEVTSLSSGTTTFEHIGLVDGTQYFYKVSAFNSAGSSDYSNIDSAITVMNKPTTLGATNPQSNMVVLTWVDNSSSEDGYIIERANTQTMPPAYIFTPIDTVGVNVETTEDPTAVDGASYVYRVKGYNSLIESAYSDSVFITLTSINDISGIPTRYELSQNYPNPFNPSTVIRYGVPEESFVSITIYNLLGEKVETLVNKYVSVGFHETTWNAANVPTGVYLISARLESRNSNEVHSFTKKAILLK